MKTVYKKLAAVFILGLFLLNAVTIASVYVIGLSEDLEYAALLVLCFFAAVMIALFVRSRSTAK